MLDGITKMVTENPLGISEDVFKAIREHWLSLTSGESTDEEDDHADERDRLLRGLNAEQREYLVMICNGMISLANLA